MTADKIIAKLPQDYKLIYFSVYGSKLYGTDNELSDTDYKGIFLPSVQDILLKKYKDVIKFNSNNTNTKNQKEDTDIELYSIYKFLELIKKGETGAVDLLFSMFREDTVLYITKETQYIKDIYKFLLSNNISAFKGYCLQQTKRYGVRGSRYGTVKAVVEALNTGVYDKVQDFVSANTLLTELPYVEADEEFFEVLGRKYHLKAPFEIAKESILKVYNDYGHRSKKASEESGYDAKAISHAYRVIQEIKELLSTGFIVFPLRDAEYIREIKESKHNFDCILNDIETQIEELSESIENSALPDSINSDLIDKLLLLILS